MNTSPASRSLAISILMPLLAAITTLLAPFNFKSWDNIKLQPRMSVGDESDNGTAITHPVGPAPRSRTAKMNSLFNAQNLCACITLTLAPNLWLDHIYTVNGARKRFGCGRKRSCKQGEATLEAASDARVPSVASKSDILLIL